VDVTWCCVFYLTGVVFSSGLKFFFDLEKWCSLPVVTGNAQSRKESKLGDSFEPLMQEGKNSK
jgi:hypothetical protein